MLEDVACCAELAWEEVMPATVTNVWNKCVGKIMSQKTRRSSFRFQNKMWRAAYNLEVEDLAAWIEVGAETLIVLYLSEDYVAPYVQNGKASDELGEIYTGSGSENNNG
jgi:hypothetical protein